MKKKLLFISVILVFAISLCLSKESFLELSSHRTGSEDITEPNLIPAKGVDGVEGFVKKDELYDTANQPKNPEEAMEYVRKMKELGYRTINIYKEDGKTVIGKYLVGASNGN